MDYMKDLLPGTRNSFRTMAAAVGSLLTLRALVASTPLTRAIAGALPCEAIDVWKYAGRPAGPPRVGSWSRSCRPS